MNERVSEWSKFRKQQLPSTLLLHPEAMIMGTLPTLICELVPGAVCLIPSSMAPLLPSPTLMSWVPDKGVQV